MFLTNCLRILQFSFICSILSKLYLESKDFAYYNNFLTFHFTTNVEDQVHYDQDFQRFYKMECISTHYQSIFSYRKFALSLTREFWGGSFCLHDKYLISVNKYYAVTLQIFFASAIFTLMTRLACI